MISKCRCNLIKHHHLLGHWNNDPRMWSRVRTICNHYAIPSQDWLKINSHRIGHRSHHWFRKRSTKTQSINQKYHQWVHFTNYHGTEISKDIPVRIREYIWSHWARTITSPLKSCFPKMLTTTTAQS